MDLIELLPEYYKGNKTMEELQGILSADINNLASNLKTTIDECFVNTATTLLSRYEKIYGIQVDVSKTNEFRRERIKAKIRGTGTVTKQMIRDVANSFKNGNIDVIEHNESYSLEIKFTSALGQPPNLADFKKALQEIKPAHIVITYSYLYLLIKQVHNVMTIDELQSRKLTDFSPVEPVLKEE